MIKHISHILGTFSLQFKILYAGLFALKRETIFFFLEINAIRNRYGEYHSGVRGAKIS